MRTGAGARRREGELARVGLRQRDQLGDRVGREVEPRHQHVGHRPQDGDSGEVLARVERQLGVEGGGDGVRGDRVEADRVAIRSRLGDDVRADIAAGAGAVLDDELLARQFGEFLADDARESVGRAAGRKHHDVFNGSIGPVALGAGDARGDHRCGERARGEQERVSARNHEFGHLERSLQCFLCWEAV